MCSSSCDLSCDLEYWDRMLVAVCGKEANIPGAHLCAVTSHLQIAECHMVDPNRYFTWRPSRSVFLSLCRDDSFGTIVHIYATGCSYFATPSCMLPCRVPAGSVVLGQYIEDVDPVTMSLSPRVLLFDLPMMGYCDMSGVPARDRYAALRRCMAGSEDGTPGCMLKVQWVGEYSCASVITQGHMQLPHPVQSLLVLRDDQVCSLDSVEILGAAGTGAQVAACSTA